MSTGAGSAGFTLSSPEFEDGQRIPRRYTCEGADVSPPLQWTDPPNGTRSLALIVDDPDAPRGTWVHWILYDLPPTTRSLPEGVPKTGLLRDGGRQGRNGFGDVGYGGPCPPRGHGPHRYFFKLYALDAEVDLPPGTTIEHVRSAIDRHTIASTQLMGVYSRD
jgi:Raf kinase inhibitor-like YbhB/YbcL family protein